MLVREGHAIPLNVAEQHFAHRADQRAFLVAPFANAGTASGECIEDDGESEAWRNGEYGTWTVSVVSDANALNVSVEWSGQFARPFERVEVWLPAADSRTIACATGRIVNEAHEHGWKRLTVELD